jgi:hypothetical protein
MVYPSAMTAPAKATKPGPSQEARAERLAAALRENLKRRKAQERAQEQAKEQSKKPTGGKY